MSLTVASIILVVAFALGGGLALYAALTGARWFFGSPGVRMLAGGMGRKAARVLYGVLGVAILGMSAYMLLHMP